MKISKMIEDFDTLEFKKFASRIGASEILDVKRHRFGIIACVTREKVWVDWETGVHTWVSLSNSHNDDKRKTGYYIPELAITENE